MPPRKEAKETVVYPASKRKPPPFKPQRPAKIPRISTTESESTQPKKKSEPSRVPLPRTSLEAGKEEDSQDGQGGTSKPPGGDSDSSEDLAADPLASKPARSKPTKAAAPPRRKPPRQPSPMSLSSDEARDPLPPSAAPEKPPEPSQLDDTTTIPQPLLIRLLHEHFADKKTKIDKHAIQVLQRYFELFVRETIARAAEQKKQHAEEVAGGSGDEVDVGWLELDDLEKVAAGMMLDF